MTPLGLGRVALGLAVMVIGGLLLVTDSVDPLLAVPLGITGLLLVLAASVLSRRS
ncbi:hypothetical protein [Aeromicrobium sp. PE09-221]|uniref:hypothetical protein n=1 Tax=Aeromicrobium sp. PE09-221 TaxID=1898043 RepID=UPI0014829CAB|nr:hypothetical protein [Aeromicrobium sp. PE09-221]